MNGLKVILLAGACMTAATGCGSGSGQSKTEVVAQANVICAQLEQQSKQFQTAEKATTPEALVRVISKIEPIATRAIDRIAALKPPSGDSEPFKRFVAISRHQIALLGDLQDAVVAGDLVRARSDLTEFDNEGVRSNIAAQQYGMTKCLDKGWRTGS